MASIGASRAATQAGYNAAIAASTIPATRQTPARWYCSS